MKSSPLAPRARLCGMYVIGEHAVLLFAGVCGGAQLRRNRATCFAHIQSTGNVFFGTMPT